MPWSAVQLKPGVDVQKTLSANEAGFSQSQMVRFKDNMVQVFGGWVNYVNFTFPSTVREMHAWEALNNVSYLGLGGTQNLGVITSGSAADITPQTRTSNNPPNISINSGSSLATVVDGGSSASAYDAIYFNTPLSVGGAYIISGGYQIVTVGGSSIYTIPLGFVSSVTSSSAVLPVFASTANSANITVTLPAHGYQAITGLSQQFIAPTTVDGLTVQGAYQIKSVIDTSNFVISATRQASASTSATMNGGNMQIVYYVAGGPPMSGSGFGVGGFGTGGFGTGTGSSGGAGGTPITATDWTMDNWGEILLSCPENGPVYAWSPDSGLQTAQVVSTAPFFNGGIFISEPQQILVCWRSVLSSGVQDNLVVRWSDATDYTNFTVSSQTTAGSFHLPTGSIIVGGIQGPTMALISTDVDVWSMQWVGGDVIFNFTRVGSACGWLGKHACGILAGQFYWISNANFFMLGPTGVVPLPCPVWDQIFQRLNTSQMGKIRCAVDSTFNEIIWFYPSPNSTENDNYVKLHVEGQEYEWDYGSLSRTAWVDASILGQPIGTDTFGGIYQHETGNSITGTGVPSFVSGWWTISEGQDLGFVDMIIPDFIWATRGQAGGAGVNLTFFSCDYPSGPFTSHGPYTVTSTTPFISTRIRGRLLSVVVASVSSDEFWRLGRIRFRIAQSGRR